MGKHIHGGDIYKEAFAGRTMLDYSANINPQGPPPSVVEVLTSSAELCANYPDPKCRKLTAALAVHENVPAEYIFCSNGAAEIIFRIVFALRPSRALLLAPTFAEYEEALLTVGCDISRHTLLESSGFELGMDIVDSITPQTDIIFLCNPNNPTGKTTSRPVLEAVLRRAADCGAVLVVDECFHEFLVDQSTSLKNSLREYDNLIIVRAFTKIFAMAGLRLGYCLASSAELLQRIRTFGQPWSVSSVAQACGCAALTETEYLRRTVELIAEQRDYLTTSLRVLGLKVFDSEINFILFKSGDTDLCGKMEAHDILIRSCENFAGLSSGFYRIAVKSEADNRRLISAFEEVLSCRQ